MGPGEGGAAEFRWLGCSEHVQEDPEHGHLRHLPRHDHPPGLHQAQAHQGAQGAAAAGGAGEGEVSPEEESEMREVMSVY